MRYLSAIILSLVMMISIDISAQSVQNDEDRFFYAAEPDEDLQVTLPDKSFSSEGIQYGAIISPMYIYEKSNNDKLNSAVLNSKVWAKTYLWKNSYLYAGVKDSYMNVLSKEGVKYANTESDNIIDLDQAFISMSGSNGSLKFSAGRKYYSIGTGLILNGRGDGAEFSYTASIFSLRLLGLYTGFLIKDNNPYGLSDKDFTDGSERAFSGGVISAAAGNQIIYIFGLAQNDLSKQVDNQETIYNSQYFGTGINGVILQDISYYAEAVFESGENYITKTTGNEKSNIAAYAVNTGLNYFIPVTINPVLTMQYAYGSGDSYRDDYTRSNRPDGASGYDKGFIAFGTYSGGYALKPSLSNIHIFRAGITVTPLSSFDSPYLKNMSIGTKYSYYIKDKKESPINDGTEATLEESFIGHGVDVSVRWKLFYDLSFYVNYGLFLPGDAYDTLESNKNFVMAGMNLSI